MIALVTGGAASGKSAYAERLALSLPAPHAYLATMRCDDAESKARIARHREERFGKGFRTIELAFAGISAISLPQGGTVLVEDIGNLVANGLEGALDGVFACDNTVFVGNEVGCDGVRYGGFTREYIDRLGALACQIASRADVVVEVVAGLPQAVKGKLP